MMFTKAIMIITGVIKHIGRLTKGINHIQGSRFMRLSLQLMLATAPAAYQHDR